MFGIGAWEMLLIGVVALLVFGPKRLPELARSMGKGLAELRRASSDLRRTIDLDLDLDPARVSAPDPETQPPAQAGEPAGTTVPETQAGPEGSAPPSTATSAADAATPEEPEEPEER